MYFLALTEMDIEKIIVFGGPLLALWLVGMWWSLSSISDEMKKIRELLEKREAREQKDSNSD